MPSASIVIVSGDAHPVLAAALAEELQLQLADAGAATFADGESRVHISADVRHATVVLVQPTSPPVNDRLVQLALLADAATAAGAARVVAVVPYFGYARQEQRSAVGDARSARVAARLLALAGIDHLVTLDLHAPALESAFPMPVTLLQPDEVFLPHIRQWATRGAVIVSPDAGGMKRAQRIAGTLGASLAVVAKLRPAPDAIAAASLLGDVAGRPCIIVDDLASTGRTLATAAQLLRDAGAQPIHAVVTHPVMVEGALERLLEAPLDRLITSNSVPPPDHPRLQVVSIAPLLANAVRNIA